MKHGKSLYDINYIRILFSGYGKGSGKIIKTSKVAFKLDTLEAFSELKCMQCTSVPYICFFRKLRNLIGQKVDKHQQRTNLGQS